MLLKLQRVDRPAIRARRVHLDLHGSFVSAALLVLLLTLAALYGAYLVAAPARLRAAVDDVIVFQNFAPVEQANGLPFRWSTGESRITGPQFGQTAQAALNLGAFVPVSRATVPLTFASGQQSWLTVPLTGQRQLHVFTPPIAQTGGNLQITLRSPTASTAADPRPLGVAITEFSWEGYGRVLPPVRQALVVPGFALMILVLLRRLRFSLRTSALWALGIGGILAAAAAAAPLQVAPYTHWLLLGALLGAVGLLLWPLLTRPRSVSLPDTVDLDMLLVLLGSSYWLMLVFQEVLCVAAGAALCARPGTAWIGGTALGLLVVLAGLPRLTPLVRQRSATVVLALSALAQGSYATFLAFWRAGAIRSGPDFFILWRAAYDFHLGRPLYKLADVLTNHFGAVYKVPPFYGMLFLPFATSDDMLVLLAHRILNVTLYLATAVLLIRLLRSSVGTWRATLGVALIMGLMQPTFETIAYGQIDVVLLFLLIVAFLSLRQPRPWLTGLAITLAGLFKLYPFLLVGLLFVRREWKVLGWMAAWFALLNGIAIGVMGWENHVIYVTQVLPNIGGGTSWVENQTLNGFLSRWLTGTMRTDPVRDPLINGLTYMLFGLIAGLALLLAAVPSRRTSRRYFLQFSLFPIVMVLAVPAAWMHYSTIVVLPFVALLWYTAEQPLPMRQAVAIALAFSLIAYGNQWSFFQGTLLRGLPMLGLSYKMYGLLLLWGVVLIHLWSHGMLRQWLPGARRTTPQHDSQPDALPHPQGA